MSVNAALNDSLKIDGMRLEVEERISRLAAMLLDKFNKFLTKS